MTGSNVINVLKGGGVLVGEGAVPPGAKAFPFVTDNRRSWLDSPFCVITQHRPGGGDFNLATTDKVKISNAKELTMQLPQTLSSAIAQIKVSFKQPNYKLHKRSCPSALLLLVLLRQARHILDRFCFGLRLLQAPN